MTDKQQRASRPKVDTKVLRVLASRLSEGIITGHDWPNTDDELLRLQSARLMHDAAAELDSKTGNGERTL